MTRLSSVGDYRDSCDPDINPLKFCGAGYHGVEELTIPAETWPSRIETVQAKVLRIGFTRGDEVIQLRSAGQ